ncbi:hypothetical protein [Actinocorallia libanotica]|uniref:YD repeat-containing protein n=1 Tax=Actinocorallia libanotica TaxID=46162 RepID=A0ABP4B4R1_9ACTN
MSGRYDRVVGVVSRAPLPNHKRPDEDCSDGRNGWGFYHGGFLSRIDSTTRALTKDFPNGMSRATWYDAEGRPIMTGWFRRLRGGSA